MAKDKPIVSRTDWRKGIPQDILDLVDSLAKEKSIDRIIGWKR